MESKCFHLPKTLAQHGFYGKCFLLNLRNDSLMMCVCVFVMVWLVLRSCGSHAKAMQGYGGGSLQQREEKTLWWYGTCPRIQINQ